MSRNRNQKNAYQRVGGQSGKKGLDAHKKRKREEEGLILEGNSCTSLRLLNPPGRIPPAHFLSSSCCWSRTEGPPFSSFFLCQPLLLLLPPPRESPNIRGGRLHRRPRTVCRWGFWLQRGRAGIQTGRSVVFLQPFRADGVPTWL